MSATAAPGEVAVSGIEPRARPSRRVRLRQEPVLPLYVRVVAVNAVILAAAGALLVFTPAEISYPVRGEQGLIIGAGLLALFAANVVLVRISFRFLESLVQRMETLDLLRPRERLTSSGGPEMRSLVNAFNAMLDRLEDERRYSARQTFSALEGERRRVSQELHDEIGQRLIAILLQLARAAEDAPEPVRRSIADVQASTRLALDQIGALAWQLRPGMLADLGLLRALEALVKTLDVSPATRIELRLPKSLPPLSEEVELAIYRVAQESLGNALRHADAETITLELRSHEGGLSLEVTDDGKGRADGSEGPGLRGMRERALLIGGRLRIDSPFGRGVRVRLDVPRDRQDG